MKNTCYWICSLSIILITISSLQAQSGEVKGKVINRQNEPISDVLIQVQDSDIQTRSNEKGNYSLKLASGNVYILEFSHVGHETSKLEIRIAPGRVYDKPITLFEKQLGETQITDQVNPTDFDDNQLQRLPIESKEIIKMPGFNRSIEAVMKNLPGVASNNEFSSQYQVRGGNFDENLVYVNDIEIYRPFLARSGQQEGLGFSNPDMAQNIQFSTGGFGAEYGDKLSSVLDITYRTPTEFQGTVEAGLITTNIHAEGRSKNKKEPEKPGKFTFQIGSRRFATSYFLNSLETQGEYRPNFIDVQGMFTYTPKNRYKEEKIKLKANGKSDTLYYANQPLKLTTFFAYTRNRYLFEPRSRISTFGTIQQAFRVFIGFVGRELSTYNTGLGAIMLDHRPNSRLNLKYILTTFQTEESERFDVEGGYLLGEVNTNFGSDEFNESEFDLGIGSEVRHARNFLNANVASAEIKGSWVNNNKATHKLRFGAKYQYQLIQDNLKEYLGLDSAEYLIDPAGQFGIQEYLKESTRLESNQYKAFLQHEWQAGKKVKLVTGGRAIYYDLIDQWMFSPRFQFVYDASAVKGGPDLRLRFASGLYQQPPFYRELRRFDGTVNLDVRAQSSLHAIAGLDYQFYLWGRQFRLLSEAYYKRLFNLIPYEIQNIRIRYYPDEVADGFAYGFDARVNGQFIKGLDSWVSLGILKTMEDVKGDDQGYVPRPSDQRVTFAMYFQDELPNNPTFKVHVNYIYGSGMRFGPPNNFDNRTAFGFPAYQRVDIGFSKLISFKGAAERQGKKGFESIWATFEIFNLFQRENTVSHLWVEDLQNRQYAVPNRLSARLFNVRVVAKFK